MQSKRKSKLHPLAGGWEESNRNIALGVLRTQAFLVVCTDGDDYSLKWVYVLLTLIVSLDTGGSSHNTNC
jgi:hypothetical protein